MVRSFVRLFFYDCFALYDWFALYACFAVLRSCPAGPAHDVGLGQFESPRRNPSAFGRKREVGFFRDPDRRLIEFPDHVPKATVWPLEACFQRLEREKREPSAAIRGIGPGIADLEIVVGKERKAPVPRSIA